MGVSEPLGVGCGVAMRHPFRARVNRSAPAAEQLGTGRDERVTGGARPIAPAIAGRTGALPAGTYTIPAVTYRAPVGARAGERGGAFAAFRARARAGRD